MVIFEKKSGFLQKMHFLDPPGGSKQGEIFTIMRLKNLPVGALECIFDIYRVFDRPEGYPSGAKPWK